MLVRNHVEHEVGISIILYSSPRLFSEEPFRNIRHTGKEES